MTIILELPPEVEAQLKEEAAKCAAPVEQYTLSLIKNSLPPRPPMPELKTGADVIAYWKSQGLIGDWANREDVGEGDAYARELRRQAETREHD